MLLRIPQSRWTWPRCLQTTTTSSNITTAAIASLRQSALVGSRSIAGTASFSSSAAAALSQQLQRTRNIGIIAHIDAGKTTTTERMLYYSGFTRAIGEVDEGSTVTDFLPAERARGITIQSAAITFHWPPKATDDGGSDALPAAEAQTLERLRSEGLPRSTVPHTINLIDTPGHADFTFEVLRSLRILDGAICILDGVAGVEAQTEKVWQQASLYRIPRIVFVNKLDREGAAFGRTVKEIALKLNCWPASCQVPWFADGGEGKFQGIGDAIWLRGLSWKGDNGNGRHVEMIDLEALNGVDPKFAQEIKNARIALVELLSEHDDQLVECFLATDGVHLAVDPLDILDSVRRCMLSPSQKITPVFAGASFRNIGVQPLLDAVANLLPSPDERPDPEIKIASARGGLEALLKGQLEVQTLGNDGKGKQVQKSSKKQKSLAASQSHTSTALQKLEACALAFKVVSDAKRGVLVYVRVYSGNLERNAALFNTSLQVSERGSRLFKMYANEALEVPSVGAGSIGVIAGLKHARTGDTLLQYPGNKATPPEPLNSLQLRPIDVPPAVFFTAVEPQSLSEEKHLHESLALLLREDPSLHVMQDEESGQTMLSGMGELHLEIARDRLVKDFKTKAHMGGISIGYRECISDASSLVTKIFDKDIAGHRSQAGCAAMVEPLDQDTGQHGQDVILSEINDGNRLTIRAPDFVQGQISEDSKAQDDLLPPTLSLPGVKTALCNGALAALARGPRFHIFPMRNTHVLLTIDLHEHIFGNNTTLAAISGAARLATQAALKEASSASGLMEPVMNVTISVNEASMGAVIHDISSSRGGHIFALDNDDEDESHSGQEDSNAAAIPVLKVYAPPDPSGAMASTSLSAGAFSATSTHQQRQIKAKVPLKEMVGYLKHLRSLTAGRGTFVMSVDRFEKMSGPREKALLAELSGI